MMKFAVNYSNPLIRLIKEKAIEIDLIKCPDWEGMLKEARPYGPITIHYDIHIGTGEIQILDLDRVRCFMKQTATPHVNAHLVTPRNFNPNDSAEFNKINLLWREELAFLVESFGAENVTLEHYPYTTATPYLRTATDPSIFSQVVQDTGCQFLLDLAHAQITADTLGVDAKDDITSLPLERLTEVHITGIKMHGGILTDHFEMDDGSWDILAWALDNIKTGDWPKPRVVAFEYGGVGDTFVWRTDYNHLKDQIPQLMDMVHAAD
jgi:uncharacterized protein (UPF0276 family)